MNNINILYVDDDAREFEPLARSIMKMVGLDDLPSKVESEGSIEYQFIKTSLKYTIVCVEDKDSALYYIKQKKFDIAFIDYHLRNEIVGTEVGLEISEAVHYNPDYSGIYLVMLTAYNESIIDTLRSGLFKDFLTKNQLNNLSDIQGIFARFEAFRESERKRIEAEKRAEKAEKSEREMYSTLRELQVGFNVNIDSFTDKNSLLKGNSEPMKQIRWFINLYSKVDLPVLIMGETGTGKELVTEEIHKKSNRKYGPFEPINCAAIPETLIESELFGVMPEAAEGVTKKRKGAFERAHNGTLFLDEFGDMNPTTQVKVLRAIETGEILPLGANKTIKVDVRVICATSTKLKEKAGNDEFRIDLFYRVGGLFPELPPLRDRKNDIKDIYISYFIQKGKDHCYTSDSVDELIKNEYNWPGNVRELIKFFDHTTTIFPDTKFDKSKTLKLLELWKTHQPVKDLANTFTEHTSDNGPRVVEIIDKDVLIHPYEVKDLVQFLKSFIKHYEEFEEMNELAPTLSEIEKILEPSNRKGWLSQRFSKSEVDSQKVIYAINNNKDLNRLRSIAPFKKFFN